METTLGLRLLVMMKNNLVEYSDKLPAGIVTFMPAGAECVYKCISKKGKKEGVIKSIFKDFVVLAELISGQKLNDLREYYKTCFNEEISREDVTQKKELLGEYVSSSESLIIGLRKEQEEQKEL